MPKIGGPASLRSSLTRGGARTILMSGLHSLRDNSTSTWVKDKVMHQIVQAGGVAAEDHMKIDGQCVSDVDMQNISEQRHRTEHEQNSCAGQAPLAPRPWESLSGACAQPP